MKQLSAIALILVIAATAVADDTFGLWREIDGDYVNYLPPEQATSPFTLLIALHDATVFSVGGYEVGIVLPPELLILSAGGPNGWTNFGDNTNQLVGFTAPVITTGDPFTLLGQIECLALTDDLYDWIIFQGAQPPSIPGHDGPVIADGTSPDVLIPCGYVNGSPEVFIIMGPDAVNERTLSQVKALFE